jgi:hypothetical protein
MIQYKLKTGKISLTAAFLFVVLIMGCDKNDTAITQELIDETAFAENVFAQLSADVEDAVPFDAVSNGRGGFGGFGFGFGNCMTRTVESPDGEDFPKTITIEYDDQCSSGFGNVVKSGKVIITLTGPRNMVGSQRIVTFEDFSINGNMITGTKTYTNNGNGQCSVSLENGQILTKDGDVIVRESTKTRTLIAGGDTEDRNDDVYEVNGEIIGVIIDSETNAEISYTKVIDSENPLIIKKDCFWITQGSVTTTIGDTVSTLDFGNGECDNLATRMDEDGEEEFTMEMRIRKMWRHKHETGSK